MKRFLAALACIPLTLTGSILELTPATAAPTAATQQAQQQQRAKAASYRRYMQLGYAANKQRDYQTAQSSFQAALQIRPGDPYATKALRNVRGFVRRNELIQAANVARQKRADALGQTLQQATAGQDWQCAVAVIDNLIPLLPANSLKRAELLAYRSRLQGLIGAEANLTRWSTICSQASLTAQGR
jgi:tetratricopeptide (TPR) repeat protein